MVGRCQGDKAVEVDAAFSQAFSELGRHAGVVDRTSKKSQKRQHVFDVIGEGGCGGVLGALACDDFQAKLGQGG